MKTVAGDGETSASLHPPDPIRSARLRPPLLRLGREKAESGGRSGAGDERQRLGYGWARREQRQREMGLGPGRSVGSAAVTAGSRSASSPLPPYLLSASALPPRSSNAERAQSQPRTRLQRVSLFPLWASDRSHLFPLHQALPPLLDTAFRPRTDVPKVYKLGNFPFSQSDSLALFFEAVPKPIRLIMLSDSKSTN